MCSSGSSATIVIKQRAYDIAVRGKPIIITTTATATPNPELTRRFVILNLDSSEDQTKKVKRRHSEYAKEGIIPEYDEVYRLSMQFLKRVRVKIPFADLIDEYFPDKSIIMRTHYPRFLDYIKASTGFHQYQREEKDGFFISDGKDYDIARKCFLKLCSNKYMIPLTINQKKLLDIFEKERGLKLSSSQFHAKFNFMSLKSVIFNLGILAKYGILKSAIEKDVYGRDLEVYSLSESYNPSENLEIPTYEELYRLSKVSKVSKTSILSKVSKVSGKKEEDGLLTLHVIPENDLKNPDFTDEELKLAGYSREELEKEVKNEKRE